MRLGRVRDAEGLIEIPLQGVEGLAAVFGVFELGVVGLDGGPAREGLLGSPADQVSASVSPASWRILATSSSARSRSSSHPAEKSAWRARARST